MLLQPLLPPSTTSYLITPAKGEVVPGAVVEVAWTRTVDEGLVVAKRSKKPLLMFLADPANVFAKQLELGAFRDAELARYVNRHFVPIKVNLDDKPEWAAVLDSAVAGFQYRDPGCRLVVFDQTGRPVSSFAIDQGTRYLGYESVMRYLVSSNHQLDDLIGTPSQETDLERQKSQEMQILESVLPTTEIDYTTFLKNVFSKRDPNYNLPGDAGIVRLNPALIRLMARTGNVTAAQELLNATLRSPLYDALDGGFFRSVLGFADPKVDTSKSVVQIASMAEVLAQLLVLDPSNPLLTELLKQSITCISSDFVTEAGIGGFRLNDQNRSWFSPRDSMTLGRLNKDLTSDERRIFTKHFDTQATRPQSIATLRDPASLVDPSVQEVLTKLRSTSAERPGLTSSDKATVLGGVAAKLFSIYSITGDVAVRTLATELSDRAYALVTKNFVYRRYGFTELGDGWLGSYLALAECGLSEYSATGNIYALRHGRNAIRLAITKFRDERSGLLRVVSNDATTSLPIEQLAFEFADSHRDGLNSTALRLAHLYAKLAVSEADKEFYDSFAYGQLGRLGGLLNPTAIHCASFYDIAFEVQRDKTILVVGGDFSEQVHKVASTIPFLPILPAIPGESAPKTLTKPGYYIQSFGGTVGPLSLAELQARL